MSTEHPDLGEEQAYINYAYDCLDEMRDKLERLAEAGGDPKSAAALKRLSEDIRTHYDEADRGLVVGRIDMVVGDTHYVGRLHITDSVHQPVVISWTTRAAEPFYSATAGESMGLARRRRFSTTGRQLLGISDEVFEAVIEAAPPEFKDLLLRELERSRTPEMHDIVATIQADQYALITRPLEGILVVQGAPGTGKTAVGLHRAVWLLANHRQTLERQGVLVVGPNRAFMQYVSQVIPSLGESSVDQSDIDHLVAGVRARATDRIDVQRLKGDARMAHVVDRAVAARIRPPAEDISVRIEGRIFAVSAEDVRTALDEARATGASYIDARTRFVDRLARLFYAAYAKTTRSGITQGTSATQADIQRSRDFQNTLDRIWPSLTAKQVIQELLAGPQRLAEAAAGVFHDGEQRTLLREVVRLEDVVWTVSDLPLLDEAEAILRGPTETFGHVILDEAQDLTPMQLRVVARRSSAGSMTVVGDIAQATGVWHHQTWADVLAHLPDGVRATVEELRIAYRVPRQIMDLALPVLALIAPDVEPPVAYRKGKTEPAFVRVEPDQLVRRLVEEVLVFSETAGTAGIIVPETLLPDVRTALATAQVEYGEAIRDPLGPQLELLTPRSAKGLEFDDVVIVEPARIVADAETHGLRELYVALTRATQHLTILHAEDLPAPLPREGRPDGAVLTEDVTVAPVATAFDATDRRGVSSTMSEAFAYARMLHARQWRRGNGTPYVAHLMGVAALVLEDGGAEDDAIAALLHDAAEDQGGEQTLEQIRAHFGENVARIVAACSDTLATPKPAWRDRKEQYLARLRTERDPAILRVALADKLHNARAIVADYRQVGASLWTHFDPASDQLWYYHELVAAFRDAAVASAMLDELDRTVTDLERLCQRELDDAS